LLRNQSKTGVGFFADGNFYPDFIIWIIDGDKQYINFIDPKGILHLNSFNDAKMELAHKIKDIEEKLSDTNTILNSFIISNTNLKHLRSMHSDDLNYPFFAGKNVFFQETDDYISKIFDKILK